MMNIFLNISNLHIFYAFPNTYCHYCYFQYIYYFICIVSAKKFIYLLIRCAFITARYRLTHEDRVFSLYILTMLALIAPRANKGWTPTVINSSHIM